ncbi:MAG: hypothetical protein Q4F55_03750 [Bacillota bacterium]|nr:hypothetical protein [Bacillota bacterium]
MIKTWLNDIKEGRPLWLAECREEMKEDAEATETKISVITNGGENKEFSILLPKVEIGEEFSLMAKFLDANRANAAFLLGQTDTTECRMPDTEEILAQMKSGKAEETKEEYQMPEEPLICGVDIGGTDIKLVLVEGERIRRVLAYDWNPSIATEAAMILNPIYELIEMAANGMKLDGIGVAFPDIVVNNKIIDGETPKTAGIRNNKDVDYKSEFEKITNMDSFLKPLCKEGAPIRILNDGYMAAYTVYNELKQTDAGREVIKDGIITLPIGTEIGFGWVDENGKIPNYPGNLYKCVFRIDNDEESHFMNQERVLKAANMPLTNPKPCVDMLINMAEGGEQNAETLFKNIGLYIGHAIREIKFFMKPKANTFIIMGRFAKSEYCFDLMSIGMQNIAPDAVVLQADEGLANTPIMKKIAEIDRTAVAQFAQAVGCIYYALEK